MTSALTLVAHEYGKQFPCKGDYSTICGKSQPTRSERKSLTFFARPRLYPACRQAGRTSLYMSVFSRGIFETTERTFWAKGDIVGPWHDYCADFGVGAGRFERRRTFTYKYHVIRTPITRVTKSTYPEVRKSIPM